MPNRIKDYAVIGNCDRSRSCDIRTTRSFWPDGDRNIAEWRSKCVFVTIQTRTGSRDPAASCAVTIASGKVSGPAGASGTVGPSGNVRVSIGPAYANGQLHGYRVGQMECRVG